MKGWLRRSLLWYRGPDTPSLKRIVFPHGYTSIPSWSWMAYTGGKDAKGKDSVGGINYFKAQFDGFEWEELELPWTHEGGSDHPNIRKAKARSFKWKRGEGRIIFDAPAGEVEYEGICVVLGVQRGEIADDEKVHYVLVVVPANKVNIDENGDGYENKKRFKRVGAGYLFGKCMTGGYIDVEIE